MKSGQAPQISGNGNLLGCGGVAARVFDDGNFDVRVCSMGRAFLSSQKIREAISKYCSSGPSAVKGFTPQV